MSHDSAAQSHNSSARPGTERREIFYTGRVQGVGFRATTEAIASRTAAVGFVRNLPDGRVEMVAEGSADELDELERRIEAELGRYIQSRQRAVRRASGEFSGFQIRH